MGMNRVACDLASGAQHPYGDRIEPLDFSTTALDDLVCHSPRAYRERVARYVRAKRRRKAV